MIDRLAIAFVCSAGRATACDRMVAIFSALWGTHSVWTRFNAWLGEKLEPLNQEYNVALPYLVFALGICAVAAWFLFAP